MGSNGSKPNTEYAASLKNDADSNSDPRSPTPEIARTPLRSTSGTKHNITKNVDLRKTFENGNEEGKLIHNNPILSAVIKNHLQSYDPRSPTQDFERTPIIISTQVDGGKNSKQLRQKNICNSSTAHLHKDGEEYCDSCMEAQESSPELILPKNLCNGFYDITLDDTIKDNSEPLGSSTASNEAIENEISPLPNGHEPKQLLETNFDYVESDNKYEDSQEDVESPARAHEKMVAEFKILEIDPRSPSIGIERTPIVVATIDENISDSNVEDMSDDSLIKVLQNTNAELRQNGMKSQEKTGDGLLVYEDEITTINDTPKKSKSNSGSRTPLSCMKNKDGVHARSKSANMLYDPKKQNATSKIPKRVSHIPRLKALTKTSQLVPTGSSISLKYISKASSMVGDCENTPPHSHRDSWDKDTSIVL